MTAWILLTVLAVAILGAAAFLGYWSWMRDVEDWPTWEEDRG